MGYQRTISTPYRHMGSEEIAEPGISQMAPRWEPSGTLHVIAICVLFMCSLFYFSLYSYTGNPSNWHAVIIHGIELFCIWNACDMRLQLNARCIVDAYAKRGASLRTPGLECSSSTCMRLLRRGLWRLGLVVKGFLSFFKAFLLRDSYSFVRLFLRDSYPSLRLF